MQFSSYARILPLTLIAAACASPDPEPQNEAEATLEQQRAMVEGAVRRAYENEGAEVVDIAMDRSASGTRFEGLATIRDSETGTEITVDCAYSYDVSGAPQLSCDRTEATE
ncbi:hypothetical protein [Parasphingopyxis marina]|uniref:Lipoprotein n=1 Tax=Parasphingopyxis marina TaxID=2761622 RepID=A0A842I2I1_9SPHN|nr:hypothetical protein [Parasphingopyxis marina]MBC2778480.1 hypothetical protein [Parasphingopyxis marina]